jgi:Schlafen, AlbA_2
MINAPIDAITSEHIYSLLENKMPEGRTIEYKQELPGRLDEEKKEFLADISSFANASGGDLIYGIAEKDGVPVEIKGLENFNEDKDISHLDRVIRDNIMPRILGYQILPIPINDPKRGPILIIRIPRSWSGPHMVTHKRTSRFFTRCSAGKYQMDVGELRAAFALTGDLSERIRHWRDDRLVRVISGETPVQLCHGPCMVLHLVPLDSFENAHRIAAKELITPEKPIDFAPIGHVNHSRYLNLDGMVTHYTSLSAGDMDVATAYCQVFRSGRIEAVRSIYVNPQTSTIPKSANEHNIIEATARYLRSLEALDVLPPIVLMCTFTGMKDLCIGCVDDSVLEPHPIDREVLHLPDVMIAESPRHIPRLLQPTFDALWNACGLVRSLNYDDDGKWIGGQLDNVPQED